MAPKMHAIKPWAIAVLCFAVAGAGCTRVSTQTGSAVGNPWTIPGVLRIAERYEPDNLNPLVGEQSIDDDISMFWAGYLILPDDHDTLVPELATAIPTLQNRGISRDGLTITYHLRPGVVWQDGAPFDADDVIFTWHAIMDPRNPVSLRGGYELINKIDRLDSHTIAIHLRHPYAPFVAKFLVPDTYCVLPRHLFPQGTDVARSSYDRLPIGTGPFRVVSNENNADIKFVANPRYWRGKPRLNEIEFKAIPNDNTLLTLMQTHEIDFFYRAPHNLNASISALPGTRVILAPFTRFADVGFNLSSPILSDLRVRKAIAYGTDRKSLMNETTFGLDLPTDTNQPPFRWAHTDKVEHYAYDPIRAAALLDAVGWKLGQNGIRWRDGQPLRLSLAGVAGDKVSESIRAVLQNQWRRIGIDAEIKSYPSDILFGGFAQGGIEDTGHFDLVYEGVIGGVDPDDSNHFECDRKPPAGRNVYRFCNAELDRLEERALTENDLGARKADYARIQSIIADQLPILPLWFDRYGYAVNTDFKNFRPAHVS